MALVLPEVSAVAKQAMLDELAAAVTPGTHAVVILDRAGWHTAKELTIPTTITPVFLPPYSPELNAVRAGLALSARALPFPPPLAELPGDAGRLLVAWNRYRAEPARSSLCSFEWLALVTT